MDSREIRHAYLEMLAEHGHVIIRRAPLVLRDTLLYNELRNVVTHVDSVLADLKANPRKYINLSIF